MPKLFPIHLEVEELAVGRVMRQLHNTPGIAKINLDMGTPKANGAGVPRGPYKPRKAPVRGLEETGEELVAKVLFGKPPMSVPQLRDAFTAQGRSAASVSSVVHKMKSNGELLSGPDGYTLTKKMRDRMRHRKASKK